MKKRNVEKEVTSEDYCFVCKDGGELYVCDYEKCCKAYHGECLGKDVTFMETGELLTCSWHFCFICKKKSQFHCYCCPIAVCQRCCKSAEFVIVRGNKGFCNECLKLALLIEENAEVDSDGEKVDFNDSETYECLFMEYWKTVREKECFKLETLHLADIQLKKGKQYLSKSHSGSFLKGEEDVLLLSSDGEHVDGKMVDKGFQCMEEPDRWEVIMNTLNRRKGAVKSKKKELIGWGSRSLIELLAFIGIDTSKQLSQREVNSIITEYIKKNNLIHPVKKNKVLCDSRLYSVFGRRSINQKKIFGLLQAHLCGSQEQPEVDIFRCSLKDKGTNGSSPCKRQRISSPDRKTHKEKKVLEVSQSCFVSIAPKNIRLVYLRRSLVEYLLKTPETFQEKVVGSFVRVKCEHRDCLQRNSHQLLQVTGIKKVLSTSDISREIVLQVSDMMKDIYIQMLSDGDFSEEECDDLRQRVRDGLIKKPTIVEFEQKARILHMDITNHRIDKELVLLQNLIDRANEKGMRRDLSEYLERRQVLQTPSERSRLLQKIPIIIAEEVELEASPEDSSSDGKERKDDLHESILLGDTEILNNDLAGDIKTSTRIVGGIAVAGEGKEKRKAVILGPEGEAKNSISRFTQGSSEGMLATNGSGDVPSPKHSSSSSLDEDMDLKRISPKMDAQLLSATTTPASTGMRSHALSQPNIATGVPLRFPPVSDVFIPGYPGWTVPIYETATEVEIPRPPSAPGIPLPNDLEWVPRHRVEDLMCMVAGLKDMVRRYCHDELVMRNTLDKLRTSQCSNQEGGDGGEAGTRSEKEESTVTNGDADKDGRNTLDKLRTSQCSNQEGGDGGEAGTVTNGDADKDGVCNV